MKHTTTHKGETDRQLNRPYWKRTSATSDGFSQIASHI